MRAAIVRCPWRIMGISWQNGIRELRYGLAGSRGVTVRQEVGQGERFLVASCVLLAYSIVIRADAGTTVALVLCVGPSRGT